MVVAGGEEAEVVETVDGDSVFRGVVANGRGGASDFSLGDVVGRLGTDKETVATEDGVSGECGALRRYE